MSVKVGELAALKTTGEIVYVLQENAGGVLGTFAVRRPNYAEPTGMAHLTEVFNAGELETVDAMKTRKMAESLSMQQQIFGLKDSIRDAEDTDKPRFLS